MSKVHRLKTWPEPYKAVKLGFKSFEVRKNDRGYKLGDFLHLYEWNPETKEYTGDHHIVDVNYILDGGQFGIEPGYIVMAINEAFCCMGKKESDMCHWCAEQGLEAGMFKFTPDDNTPAAEDNIER